MNLWTKHFDRDLSRGEFHEHIVLQYLQKFYPSAYKIDGYFKGYDIFIPEIKTGIEVKYDYASNRTGNILIELEFPVGTPSALRTTEAVWWFITDGKDYFSIRTSNIENFAIKNNIKAIQKRGDGDAEPKLVWLLPKKKFLIYKGKEGELPYIKNTHTGKIVSLNNGRTNYPCVKIHPHIYALHVLVCMAFIPNPLPKDRTQVDHIDGDKFNYAIENLRWVTPSENMLFVHSKKEIELDL